MSPAAPPAALRRGLVLAVVGPTASGKSAVALGIARRHPSEIVSADSRQVYRGMAIGTAQPAAGELAEVPHHFVGEIDPADDFNAGRFGVMGRKVIAGILDRGRLPLVVGGSGLYVRSLLDGLFEGPEAAREVRAGLEARLRKPGGPEELLRELGAVDPATAGRLLPSNTRRLIRALEVYTLSGTPISTMQQKTIDIPFDTVRYGLRWPREVLYERMNARVIAMVNEGLVEETQRLLESGYAPVLPALQSVGYREAIDHISGRTTRAGMIAAIQMNTRRFAKRQLTWFRADASIRWIDLRGDGDLQEAARAIADGFHAGF